MSGDLSSKVEWDALLDLAQKEASSEPAKALLTTLRQSSNWAQSLEEAQEMQQETKEVFSVLHHEFLWGSLLQLPDPFPILQRLKRQSVLDIVDWVHLRQWIHANQNWRQLAPDEIFGENLKKAIFSLPELKAPLKILNRLLTEEGEISESASPEIFSLFQSIRDLKQKIESITGEVLARYSQKNPLQGTFSDTLEDKQLIAVRTSERKDFEGARYGSSASGQTLYIEPKEIAPYTQALRQKKEQLQKAIHTLLLQATLEIAPFREELQFSFETLIHWDFVGAKARLSLRYSGRPLEVTSERCFLLRETAHPLLWWTLPSESIVRNDIEWNKEAQIFLLTGPNAGGKTVFLKTLGLVAICARTGFPFPGVGIPKVPFFSSIFADLGDPQSIQNNLSSFSGHLLELKKILSEATENSLVLVDELNSATDPKEGSAFSRAVLEHFMERGVCVVATTHDPLLKALSLSDPRILNSSVQFSEEEGVPTYRMVQGIPGSSRALETAERLGIPAEILKKARSYLSSEHLEFEDYLTRLEVSVVEAERASHAAQLLEKEALELREHWLQKINLITEQLVEKMRQRLRKVLEQAQDEVRSAVRKLDEARTRKSVDETRASLNQIYGETEKKIEESAVEEVPELQRIKKRPTVNRAALRVGGKVRVPKWKANGILLELGSEKVRVALGVLQVTLRLDEVEPL